jgi:predicted ArsR family transcriptional regulator
MAELLDLGQASPSDDALQNRLGLTRGRITALLRELLDEGLVEAGRDRSSGPGRPKTIYRPRITTGR